MTTPFITPNFITADDTRYDSLRTGFQTYRPHRPDVIVEARDAADVQAAVRYARDNGLPVAVQSSGHGLATAAEGGVLIDTRHMAEIRIDAAAGTVVAGAGAKWKDVIPAAAEHGLAPLCGSAPDVGVVGYTLGGGFGILSREFGYAADLVRSIDVVTADGELRHATAETNTDLFWALRGGRDNVGIVTSIEIELLARDMALRWRPLLRRRLDSTTARDLPHLDGHGSRRAHLGGRTDPDSRRTCLP